MKYLMMLLVLVVSLYAAPPVPVRISVDAYTEEPVGKELIHVLKDQIVSNDGWVLVAIGAASDIQVHLKTKDVTDGVTVYSIAITATSKRIYEGNDVGVCQAVDYDSAVKSIVSNIADIIYVFYK